MGQNASAADASDAFCISYIYVVSGTWPCSCNPLTSAQRTGSSGEDVMERGI